MIKQIIWFTRHVYTPHGFLRTWTPESNVTSFNRYFRCGMIVFDRIPLITITNLLQSMFNVMSRNQASGWSVLVVISWEIRVLTVKVWNWIRMHACTLHTRTHTRTLPLIKLISLTVTSGDTPNWRIGLDALGGTWRKCSNMRYDQLHMLTF